MSDTTDFSIYKLGYIDGYLGNEARLFDNKNYLYGYEEGAQDDTLGAEMKYCHNESR
jgi:hypothetical protein